MDDKPVKPLLKGAWSGSHDPFQIFRFLSYLCTNRKWCGLSSRTVPM